jgi:hypothetical protein
MGGSWFKANQGRKLEKPYLKKMSQVWRSTSCNSSNSGGRGRRTKDQGQLSAKQMEPYLKNKLKQKGLGKWLKWYSSCLASTRPCVQAPKSQKKKKRGKRG